MCTAHEQKAKISLRTKLGLERVLNPFATLSRRSHPYVSTRTRHMKGSPFLPPEVSREVTDPLSAQASRAAVSLTVREVQRESKRERQASVLTFERQIHRSRSTLPRKLPHARTEAQIRPEPRKIGRKTGGARADASRKLRRRLRISKLPRNRRPGKTCNRRQGALRDEHAATLYHQGRNTRKRHEEIAPLSHPLPAALPGTKSTCRTVEMHHFSSAAALLRLTGTDRTANFHPGATFACHEAS